MSYTSGLNAQEWSIVEPLLLEYLPKKKRTRPLKRSYREIFDAVLYQLKNGCNWRDLPKDFPPYSTVYWHYKQWRESGLIEQLLTHLHEELRRQVKKNPQWTTLLLIDSQAVKNTCNAGVETKGYCFYKSTNGIKRHLAVDSLGFPIFTHCTKANISDDKGLVEILTENIDYFKNRPLDLPKLTILLDNGYHPDAITKQLVNVYPEIMDKVQFELSPKPSKQEKVAQGKTGFVPVKARWVVERSNAWVERCKSLVKNFERNLFNANQKLKLCFVRLLFKRLATLYPLPIPSKTES